MGFIRDLLGEKKKDLTYAKPSAGAVVEMGVGFPGPHLDPCEGDERIE